MVEGYAVIGGSIVSGQRYELWRLYVHFDGLNHQEIGFCQWPEVRLFNGDGFSCVLVNGLPYVTFPVEASGYRLMPVGDGK